MEVGSAPRSVTSRRSIRYRPSAWCKHNFEVWSGELVCKVVVLRMDESLLVWIGGAGQPQLSVLALGVPAPGQGKGGLATTLIGAVDSSTAMVRRLAAALHRPVYIACSSDFDRFTLPLVERGLIAEIKSRPECFVQSK